jgi:hypothetical protein
MIASVILTAGCILAMAIYSKARAAAADAVRLHADKSQSL